MPPNLRDAAQSAGCRPICGMPPNLRDAAQSAGCRPICGMPSNLRDTHRLRDVLSLESDER